MVKISVIMTFFSESPQLLSRSVGSILNQTIQDFEFIIIAGNPENTASIEFIKNKTSENNKIVFQVGENKLLMTVCLNRAIKLATGNYIALQESDDESLPQRLERELEVMEKDNNIDVVGTAIAYRNENDKQLIVTRVYPVNPRKAFNKYAAIAHPTVFAKRELYDKFGYYSEKEEVRHSPDYELWFRWVSQGVKFYNIQDVLFNYYQSADNGRNKNAKKTLLSGIKLKEEYARKMNFDLSDYFYLNLERLLSIIPQIVISKLFYVWVRIKN